MAIKAGIRQQKGGSRTHALAARVLEILAQEHAALENGQAESLAALSSSKELAIGELKAMVAPAGLRGHDPALVAVLQEAATANAVNGHYVAARLAYTRARLGGLTQAAHLARAAVDSVALYQADGFTGGIHARRASYGHV